MNTIHIHIRGRVQGVGFRPMVYRVAHALGLHGEVSNRSDGVHIMVNATEGRVVEFIRKLMNAIPPNAIIEEVVTRSVAEKKYAGFAISRSTATAKPDLLITPDFGICQACLEEMRNSADRRYGYPFITCTHCGPRYSIITGLPYDRPRTTMEPFAMCADCTSEYENVADRRFYAQTNSCAACAVLLQLRDLERNYIEDDQEQCVAGAVHAILEGKILAVKGIGGYLLMADATNADAVRTLRRRKHRPFKPFALIYPSLEDLQNDVWISDSERSAWYDPVAPIVLYRCKPAAYKRLPVHDLAPGLDRLGVMPPCTPLFALLLDRIQKPVVATSGNLSGSPIIYEDNLIIDALGNIADIILSNNRSITVPQDDSVLKYSSRQNAGVVIRRSRGLAPAAQPGAAPRGYDAQVLAMGAEIKSAFALWDGRRAYLSQFLGDTGQLLSQQSYENTLCHLMHMLRMEPSIVLTDAHPDYYSTQYGRQLAEKYGVQVVAVQHHEAHFASVLAENNLLECDRPVLGIVFDGTGYGHDGAIWGGEVFVYQNRHIKRRWHVPYYPHIGGDRMAEDPKVAALAVFHQVDADGELSRLFEEDTYAMYTSLHTKNGLRTSSVGRIFDAVAAIGGICLTNTYEGQSALLLEALAESFPGSPVFEEISDNDPGQYYRRMLERIWEAHRNGKGEAELATLLHHLLAGLIVCIIENENIADVCLTGGVFQNTVLIDLLMEKLSGNCTLYLHKNLSPNDEGVAYGQLAHHCWGVAS